MKRLLIVIGLFCAVNDFGFQGPCFLSHSQCREWVEAGDMWVACIYKAD